MPPLFHSFASVVAGKVPEGVDKYLSTLGKDDGDSIKKLLQVAPDGVVVDRVLTVERQLGVEKGVITNTWREEGVVGVGEGVEIAVRLKGVLRGEGNMQDLANVVGKMIQKFTTVEAEVVMKAAKGGYCRKRKNDEINDENVNKKAKPPPPPSLMRPYQKDATPEKFNLGLAFDPVHPKKPNSWNTLTTASVDFLVDLKYDGERLLIHKLADNDFHFFSRNMLPVPEKKLEGVVEILSDALKNIRDCVLDAEILSKHTFGGLNPIPKDVVALHPIIYIFDVLFLDGVCLLNASTTTRRAILSQHVVTKPKYVELPMSFYVKGTPAERHSILSTELNKIFSKQLEGVVAKPSSAGYILGDKNLWIKVKRGYLDGITSGAPKEFFSEKKVGNLPDTLDLPVIGYNVGSRGEVEKVLLGVWCGKKKKFLTVGLCENTQNHIFRNMTPIQRKKSKVPDFVSVHPSMVPDYILKSPTEATILEIDGERITEDWTYTCGYMKIIRPVIIRVREDKSLEQADGVRHVTEIFLATRDKGDELNHQCDDLWGEEPTAEQLRTLLHTGKRENLLKIPSLGEVYAFCSAYGGHWCKKGAMGAATRIFGASPRADFSSSMPTHQLSQIIVTPPKEGESTGTACCMLAQFYPPNSTPATVPTLDIDAWEICLRKLARYIAGLPKPTSVHLARPAPGVPGYNWPAMEKVIQRYFISQSIPVHIYDPTALPL